MKIKAGDTVAPHNRIVLEIVGEGRITPMYIPIVLLGYEITKKEGFRLKVFLFT